MECEKCVQAKKSVYADVTVWAGENLTVPIRSNIMDASKVHRAFLQHNCSRFVSCWLAQIIVKPVDDMEYKLAMTERDNFKSMYSDVR